MGNIFSAAANMLPGFYRRDKAHTGLGLFGLFLHHQRIAAFRHRRAGHDADTGARRPGVVERLAGEGLTGDRQRGAVAKVVQPDGIAIHRRVIKAGHVQRGDDVMGGHTREGLQQRYSFRRVQRRNTIEHLGEGCVERHQSGGKIHGSLLRAKQRKRLLWQKSGAGCMPPGYEALHRPPLFLYSKIV
ncbi:hypothetical protein H216_3728 [Klebsiella pneumoniae DMC0526]|nr:hypothetical protein H216_3728 [Klebsiella pneumoniae DMC0526]